VTTWRLNISFIVMLEVSHHPLLIGPKHVDDRSLTIFFFFSSHFSLSTHWDLCWPIKIKRCHVILFLYQMCFLFFLLLFVLFYILFLIDFLFTLIPHHLVSFNFYIKFNHRFFYCYLILFNFIDFFLISSLSVLKI
jgi:hypothetical protein